MARTEDYARTPLHVAAQDIMRLDCGEVLLQAGADVAASCEDGETPLHTASCYYSGNWALARLILARGECTPGFSVDARWAAPRGSAGCLGPYVQGATALHIAADGAKTEVVRALAEAGADLFAMTDNGKARFPCSCSNAAPPLISAPGSHS